MSFLTDSGSGSGYPSGASEWDETDLEVRSSPVGLLAIAGAALLAGVLGLMFWGVVGAAAAYVAALVALGLILVFRRVDSSLRHSAVVSVLPGLSTIVGAVLAASVLLIAASAWVIATELSRNMS